MFRIFRHYIPKSLIVLGIIECMIVINAFEFAIQIRLLAAGMTVEELGSRVGQLSTFVLVFCFSMIAFGLYATDAVRDLKISFIRLSVSFVAGVVLLALVFYIFPVVSIWRSIVVIAMALAFWFIMLARVFFNRFADLDRFKANILVLGAGAQAKRLVDLVKRDADGGFRIVGCVSMSDEKKRVADALDRSEIDSLAQLVEDLGVSEIVLAIEERRGTLPLQDLLACKMQGCRISDFVVFVEKVLGYVDLDTVQPSWLIFSQRFGSSSRPTRAIKRAVDVSVSLITLVVGLPIFLFAALAIKLTSRGPIFYKQDRVGIGGQTFKVIKFRSMRIDAEADGIPKWADEDDPRVTKVGSVLRAARIDELPQIINVLRGDMSFVGPRPERPFFVDTLVGQMKYYNERHSVKPGITGWAQLKYPYGASVEDSKRKLEYDLYYIKNYSFFLDFLILLQTVKVVFWPDGVR